MIHTDIDLDVAASVDPAQLFPGSVRASQLNAGKLTPHPCGVYLQEVPIDPVTGLAAAPYKQAEELGCFKIDFLHLHVYDHFSSRDEMLELLKHEPEWALLQVPSVVKLLFQLSNHLELLKQVRPTSLLQLADCLALLRPQKRFILKYYLSDPERYRPDLYSQGEGEGYGFKKAHALAYAMVVVLQLHLIKGGVIK